MDLVLLQVSMFAFGTGCTLCGLLTSVNKAEKVSFSSLGLICATGLVVSVMQ
ncbi:hypothetical protein BRE01_60370 [Brevibacillus reuszeri]|uniref:Uncharacterized protein n=1 Tax=Brevibacillus reuszeri TaxID=54915 RepID=A0ABQ0TX84_9BACL|nr:hypothetical protein [Brevibacillus reuszeri]MED1859173.1 hypothetical protein [Brevibacillus reuszeri]GED72335.1 hypothetical protein BRE01_60370 [Brevibacillus reuszeri]